MRVPMDDLKLEMEETEGLIISPPQETKQALKSGNRALGNRWACFMLFVGILLGIVLTSDTESLEFQEGKGGENVNAVEEKVYEPTMSPSSSPSLRITPVPTAEPTPIPTVELTPDPTPEPTPIPTEETTPAPTDELVETPPPTDSVAETPPPTTVIGTPQPTDAVIAEGIPGAVPEEDINDADIDFGPSHYPKPSTVVKPERPLTAERAEALAEEWGMWEFVDSRSHERPNDDYCGQYPNRDIPRDKFPENAWQIDKDYLREWLDQGSKLVDRAMESILSEYGHGAKDEPDKTFEDRSKDMFDWLIFEPEAAPKTKSLIAEGGWTTEKSFQGLVRRLLHAIVTNDSFTFVLGGHSAAAGHGNHFKQSYAMQFHKVMEPVFGLLGVTLFSHNVAQGGLGTLQHSLGFKDIYGDKIDFMVWDSGMTESRDSSALDMFWRQALISGDRVPYLMGAGSVGALMYYNQNADADFGNYGEATVGLPICTDELQCEKFPWAARFIRCNEEAGQFCAEHKWRSNCWVERKDVTPTQKQDAAPGSQVKWHQGFRTHQLIGRNLSFLVLKALKQALTKWKDADEYALPDDAWHVTAYYANVRNKVHEKEGETDCYKSEAWPKRMCSTPMRAYTEFLPRPNPEKTSLLSILKPAANGFKPHIHPGNLYNGPDVFNPFTAVPEGEIDVLAIVSNGRTYEEIGKGRRLGTLNAIEPGFGTGLVNSLSPGYCDGTYNSECGRQGSCLLSGQGDSRGCIGFHSYSGWIVMTLPQIKEGIIVSKIETYHSVSELPVSSGWKSINNQGRRHLRVKGSGGNHGNVTVLVSEDMYNAERDGRILGKKAKVPKYCDNFLFQFAIDGKVTSWDKATFLANSKNPQRVVEIQTLLDDQSFTTEAKDVELAIRMTGCGDSTQKTMCLSHVYFA